MTPEERDELAIEIVENMKEKEAAEERGEDTTEYEKKNKRLVRKFLNSQNEGNIFARFLGGMD